jgi:hypothetical protein
VGVGGGWGWGGSSGGWTPSGFGGFGGSGDPPLTGLPDPDATLTYLQKLETILRYGSGAISNHPDTIRKKAALIHRTPVLMEVGRIVEAGGFYDPMARVMHGIFDDAHEPMQTRRQAVREGYVLAQDVVRDSNAVRLKVFQAELVAVGLQVFRQNNYALSSTQLEEFIDTLLELGKTYARLEPAEPTDLSTATTPDFLDSLWRAQKTTGDQARPTGEIRGELLRAIAGLDDLLDNVSNPLEALKFVTNLLKAATQVATLDDQSGEIRNGRFLRELVAFGFEFFALNPTRTQVTANEALQTFLNTLLQEGDTYALQSQGGLSLFFQGSDNLDESLKLLDFADNLIDAAQQVSSLGSQRKDAKFLSYLVNLGSAYTALDLQPFSTAEGYIELTDSFLEVLRQARTAKEIRQGAERLSIFFNLFDLPSNTPDNRLEAFKLQQDIISNLSQTPILWDILKDPLLVTPLFIEEGYSYEVSKNPFRPTGVEVAQSNPAAYSGLAPYEPRPRGTPDQNYIAEQYQHAISSITQYASYIFQMANEFNVTPDAIAGVILWEALENPYPLLRRGTGNTPGAQKFGILGKIHASTGDVAEKIEKEGRVPAPPTIFPTRADAFNARFKRLLDPLWAIRYIAAILDRAADIYEQTAREYAARDVEAGRESRPIYNIRDQASILAALYHGGKVEERAEAFEIRRTSDPEAVPLLVPEKKAMGPWVSSWRWWIRYELLAKNGCLPQGFAPDKPPGTVPILNIPYPPTRNYPPNP